MLRDAAARYRKVKSDSWARYHNEYQLGASLAGQGRLAEAEPLLIAGYRGMVQRENSVAASFKSFSAQARDRIIQFYQDWGKPEKAAEFREATKDAKLAQNLP
jgi:hypothetical protein